MDYTTWLHNAVPILSEMTFLSIGMKETPHGVVLTTELLN